MNDLESFFDEVNFTAKSLEKEIDQKMFGWLYVLLDYSYPGEDIGNVEKITKVLIESYKSYTKKHPEIPEEVITSDIYYKKISHFYDYALIVEKERNHKIN